jgi:hypothetical protein
VIDPRSTAGVLLREHDTAHQALEYARRKVRQLAAMQNGRACDYLEAVKQLEAVTCGSCGLLKDCNAHRFICERAV